jgi:GDPmannose 4,6-dehydratase
MAFGAAGLDYRKHVITDPQLYRPAEVDLLVGDPARAMERLGWTSKTSFDALVREMVEADCCDAGVNIMRQNIESDSEILRAGVLRSS